MDLTGYRIGRSEGLQSYCRLDNAINEGLAGRSYEHVCPAQMESNFQLFHEAGYRVQNARSTLFWWRVRNRPVEPAHRAAVDPDYPHLRDTLRNSDRRIDDARSALRSAEFNLDRLRQDLRRSNPY